MRRTIRFKIYASIMAAAGLAGCVGDNGSVTMSSLGTDPLQPPSAPPAVAPKPVSLGPLLEGPLGSKLTEADRQSAFTAETEALSSGDRKTWRGSKGVYGFVVPASTPSAPAGASGGGECRSFTHTIYFAGRPQSGSGTGCKDPDGGWRIVG